MTSHTNKSLLKANFHSEKLSVDWNGQENFLCLVSFGLELMTLTQRKIVFSVPIHG